MLHDNFNPMRPRPGLAGGPQMQMLSEVASFGQVGIQWKGYNASAVSGTTSYDISQPGNMKLLAGCAIFASGNLPTTEILSLNINSNLVLDAIPALAICPQGPTGHVNNGMAFFPLYRPLEGNDSIKLTVVGTINLPLTLVLYYLPS